MNPRTWGRKRVLAILVSVDVSWHLFESAVGVLGTELALIVSTGLELVPQPVGIELTFQGLILFAAFYQAVPVVFPPTVESDTATPRFRALSSILSTVLGLPLLIALTIPGAGFAAGVATIALFVFTTQVFVYYYRYRREDGIFTDELPTQILASLFRVRIERGVGQSDQQKNTDATQLSKNWSDTEHVAASCIGASSALCCLFLGLLGAVGANTFPILESIIAIWLLGGWLESQRELGPRSMRVLREIEDLELRVYSYLNVLRGGREGLYGILIVVLGFSISVRLLRTGVSPILTSHFQDLTNELWQLILTSAPPEDYIVPFEELSWVVIPVAVGLFNLWYWYRILQRLPHSVDELWVATRTIGPQPLVRRPSLYILTAGWLLFSITQLSAIIQIAGSLSPAEGPVALTGELFGFGISYAVLWPTVLIVLGVLFLRRNIGKRASIEIEIERSPPYVGISFGTVPRDPARMGILLADDPEDRLTESELRVFSITVAVVGYIGLNTLILLVGSFGGGVLRSIETFGDPRLEAAHSIVPLGPQPILTYVYIGLGLLLLSWSMDAIPMKPGRRSDRVLILTEETIESGGKSSVARKLLWVLLAEFSIAITVVQIAFQSPLPLWVMLLISPIAVVAITIFSYGVCGMSARLYDGFSPAVLDEDSNG